MNLRACYKLEYEKERQMKAAFVTIKLTSGFGVFSVWMKIVRLLVGESALTPLDATDC